MDNYVRRRMETEDIEITFDENQNELESSEKETEVSFKSSHDENILSQPEVETQDVEKVLPCPKAITASR